MYMSHPSSAGEEAIRHELPPAGTRSGEGAASVLPYLVESLKAKGALPPAPGPQALPPQRQHAAR
jgi:hypothetical protein